jgi:hypothetical protein
LARTAIDWLFFSVVVPGGPINGKELAFDKASRQITPPLVIPLFYTCQFTDNVTQTALNNLDVNNQSQAWVFNKLV